MYTCLIGQKCVYLVPEFGDIWICHHSDVDQNSLYLMRTQAVTTLFSDAKNYSRYVGVLDGDWFQPWLSKYLIVISQESKNDCC